MAAPNAIDHLIKLCSRLPGLGPRSARRVVLSLIRKRETHLQPLIQALQAVNDSIVTCSTCGNLDSTNPCNICEDVRRDPSILCVVEELADLWAIERSHLFRGRFHVLGGVLSAIDGITPDKLNIHSLIQRAKDDAIQEVIIATNATVDGQTTAHYITERLQDANVRITRLAQGIPIGAELDYLDDGTLGTALRARLPV